MRSKSKAHLPFVVLNGHRYLVPFRNYLKTIAYIQATRTVNSIKTQCPLAVWERVNVTG
jgi:hypothetical protein